MRIGLARPHTTLAWLMAAGIGIAAAQQPQGGGGGKATAPQPPPLRLTTTAFADSTTIPTKYTCAAQPSAVSPALQWNGVPKDTVSFALMVHDPEPRPGKRFDDILHWMVWNIPGNATQLPEGVPPNAELPDGTRQLISQANNASVGYRGPCAPPGIPHHYMFELFALDQKLDLAAGATRADVIKAIDGHIVGHAVLVGLFHR